MKIIGSALLLLFIAINGLYAQTEKDNIVVLPLKMSAPANAKKLGSIKAGNNATQTHCDYEALIIDAKQKAKAMGGNLVKITELIQPAFISKCYSFKADVYAAPDLSAYEQQPDANPQPATNDAAYATLYIYRLPDTTMATHYKLHLNDDSVLCTVKGKWGESFRLNGKGDITLWAETEKRQDLKINIQSGHDYYVRCGVKNGDIRMVPVLQLVDEHTGKEEYERFTKKKKDVGVNYLQQVH